MTCPKIRYEDRPEALVALRAFMRRRPDSRAERLRPYHCANCGGFHLGRSPKDRPPEHRVFIDMKAKARRYWELVLAGPVAFPKREKGI